MLDDLNLDFPEETPPPPEPGGSRRFLVLAGVLGVILLLALVAIGVYALVILPQQQAAQPVDEGATITAAALALQASQTTEAPTETETPTSENTATASNTPTATGTSTPITPVFTIGALNSSTETVQALLTQAALAQTQAAQGTQISGTATPTVNVNILPDSGFGDNAGIPGLVIATALLLVVILSARRLRSAPRS